MQLQFMFAKVYSRAHVKLRRLTAAMATCTLFVLFNATAVAEDDQYLKALEIEAEKSANVGKNSPKKSNRNNNNSKAKFANTNKSKKTVSRRLDERRIKFEQLLQFELPSTYKFYDKLSEEKQAAVYDAYKRSNKLSTASKKIFDLYFQQPK